LDRTKESMFRKRGIFLGGLFQGKGRRVIIGVKSKIDEKFFRTCGQGKYLERRRKTAAKKGPKTQKILNQKGSAHARLFEAKKEREKEDCSQRRRSGGEKSSVASAAPIPGKRRGDSAKGGNSRGRVT